MTDLFRVPQDDTLTLTLDGWEGPLDLLLTLARAQKVDLHAISILALVEQYLAFLDQAKSLKLEIERSLQTLTERQKEVVCFFFGIGVDHPLSLEDIGEKFNLTRERVRQIKDKAISKLRTQQKSHLLRSYLG